MFENELYQQLEALGQSDWVAQLKTLLPQRYSQQFHGKYDEWRAVLEKLPVVKHSSVDLDTSCVRIGTGADMDDAQREQLEKLLREFHPWRKGPFDIFGIHIDTEWRSDWKWDRFKDHIAPLNGRKVLDIGCGSGYHCWRMRGAGADFVLGVDPTLVFVMQFHAIQYYIRDPAVHVIPLGIENLATDMHCFDTVFSMGILYHRRNPKLHLQELRGCLVKEGELVLETLVLEAEHGELLVPEGRYAQMRNVWVIPSVETLTQWLADTGFKNIRCVDVTTTTSAEQRVTDWMRFQSLSDFLDPGDPTKTVEGHPAPVRAVMIANC